MTPEHYLKCGYFRCYQATGCFSPKKSKIFWKKGPSFLNLPKALKKSRDRTKQKIWAAMYTPIDLSTFALNLRHDCTSCKLRSGFPYQQKNSSFSILISRIPRYQIFPSKLGIVFKWRSDRRSVFAYFCTITSFNQQKQLISVLSRCMITSRIPARIFPRIFFRKMNEEMKFN